MNILKKYWDSVYVYILLLIPGLCIFAGAFWTIYKLLGYYSNLSWLKIGLFDLSQIIYLGIALYFIFRNRREPSYILNHLKYVKIFILLTVFIQYNNILLLFPSVYVWECTFLFFIGTVFFFDSKMTLVNILSYLVSLFLFHILMPEKFLPLEEADIAEIIAFRVANLILVAFCVLLIVYFVEKFLIQAQENREENVYLLEKQLEYYKNAELLDTELRKFRHDIKNHFICLEHLFSIGKKEELQLYFQDLQKSFAFQERTYFSGNEVVDAILNYDLTYHCMKEVKITVYGTLPNLLHVSSMDLCMLFSNMLSNSINAANRCAEWMEPELSIHFQSGTRYFSISISNSIDDDESDMVKIGKKNQSNRRDKNHGFGLHKIAEVLEKYDGRFEQYTEGQMITIKVYLPI